jgi:hypothetical protein
MPTLTKADVESFTNSCVKLRSHYEHYNGLFRSGALRLQLLEKIATVFFHDLNDILIRVLIGDICRLTDPPTMGGKVNLTVKYLAENADFPAGSAVRDRLAVLDRELHAFRDLIVPARNKRIAHNDRSAALSDVSLGAAPYDAWDRFWLNLQEFVHILHQKYVDAGGHFQLNGITGLSDAELLIKALRESAVFEELYRNNEFSRCCADAAFNSRFSEA